MKKFLIFYLGFVLIAFGKVSNRFEAYFYSDVEFQVLEEYENIILDKPPERFYRIQDSSGMEFVGIYDGSYLDEIDRNLTKSIGGRKLIKVKGAKSIFYNNESSRVYVRYYDNNVFILISSQIKLIIPLIYSEVT